MWGDWRAGWAKRHPLQWGAFNAVIWFAGAMVFSLASGRITGRSLLFALALALVALVLGTLGGYLARRMKPY